MTLQEAQGQRRVKAHDFSQTREVQTETPEREDPCLVLMERRRRRGSNGMRQINTRQFCAGRSPTSTNLDAFFSSRPGRLSF